MSFAATSLGYMSVSGQFQFRASTELSSSQLLRALNCEDGARLLLAPLEKEDNVHGVFKRVPDSHSSVSALTFCLEKLKPRWRSHWELEAASPGIRVCILIDEGECVASLYLTLVRFCTC